MKIPFANSIFSFSQKADANPMTQSLKDFSRTRASISAVVAVLLAVVYFSGTAYAQVVSGDYFVFEAGSSWRWLVTANATVVGEVDSTIADETTPINGVDTVALQFSDGSRFFFSEDPAGYKIHRLYQPSAVELQPGVFVDVTITFDPAVVFVGQVVDPGDTFTGSGTATVELAGIGADSVSYQSESTFLGIESVSVPAGDFNDTMHLDSSFSLSGTLLGQPFAQVQSFEQWVGRSVGFVKFIQEVDGVGTTNELLTSSFIDTPVDLSGTIKTAGGTDICAMVLASGQYMFSCNPAGVFSLSDLPRENNGTVKRQIYADGFFPKIDILSGTTDDDVVMTRSGACPSYNDPYDPAVMPGSAGKRIDIAGKVLLQDSQTPLCAMVLANGQYMFSCDGTGSYALNIPLDNNGQFKLQVYADGFAPTIQTFDEFSPSNDVRMARAVECQ
jgi:hypothetical protein